MKFNIDIDGVEQLMRRFGELKNQKMTRRVMSATLKGGLDAIGKQMKKDLDPEVKSGKTAVKSRVMFRKSGELVAKVGFGVGRKKKKTVAQKARAIKKRQGRKRGTGVGISGQNVHWWIAGTAERRQLTTGQRTGIMPAMQRGLASKAQQKVSGRLMSEMEKKGRKAFDKELRRINRGKR